MSYGGQDWTEVVIRKKAPKPSTPQQAVAQAKQKGMDVETVKKFNAGTNKKGPALNARKVDNEEEGVAALPKVDRAVSQAIVDGRRQKDITQKQLAVAINELVRVVNDYEAGKAIPDQRVLAKMERALGVKLRGKDLGAPL